MVEVGSEVGDGRGHLVDRIFVSVADEDGSVKPWEADVGTGLSIGSCVLSCLHVGFVVGRLRHPLEVEELSGEDTIGDEVVEVASGLVDVEDSQLAPALAKNPTTADHLSDSSVVLSAELSLHDLR